MKVLMVEPMKKAYEAEIGKRLEDLQSAVGGDIEAVYPYEEPVAIVCNDEGKFIGLPLNRALRDEENQIYDVLAGTFFVCGLGEDDFDSLPPELMDKFKEQFLEPEAFTMINGNIYASKVPESEFAQKSISKEIKSYER